MMSAKFLRYMVTASLAALVSFPALAAKVSPKVSHSVSPAYPAELFAKNVQGKAVLNVVVTDTGDVGKVDIVSADFPEFGTSAMEAVKQWKFSPATEDGKAITMTVQVPIVFTLPPDKRFNAKMGRDVFKQISDPIVPETDLDNLLHVVKAPVADWPAGLDGDPSAFQVGVRVVVAPDGVVFNPEVFADTPVKLIMPALEAVAQMKFEPPVYKGKPTYAVGEALVLFVDAAPPAAVPAAEPVAPAKQ